MSVFTHLPQLQGHQGVRGHEVSGGHHEGELRTAIIIAEAVEGRLTLRSQRTELG